MKSMKTDSPEAIGSVKAAISLFGDRINGKKQEKIKKEEEIEDESRAETELFDAKKLARELAQKIEETNRKTNEFRKSNTEITKRPLKITSNNDPPYEEVMTKLEIAKRELVKLKLDVNNVFQAKKQAEKQAEALASKALSDALAAEELTEKLEQAEEEHVIVELARIEAERETREIREKREMEAKKYKRKIESMQEKIKKLQKETSHAKELEERLETTNSDVIVLQNEMEFVRAMESNTNNTSNEGKDDLDKNIVELESVKEELKSRKNELESIKAEGFQYMSYMDRTRTQILKIREEVYMLKERETKAVSSLQNLNLKVLKAKSRLESGLNGEERTKIIITNLEEALQQIRSEIERAKNEKDSICEQTEKIRTENEKICTEKITNEEKLREVVNELKMVKASEKVAMKRLKGTIERTINSRFEKMDQRNNGGMLNISKLEYDYLIHGAEVATSVADKKVAACRVWIKALKSSEKETRMKTEILQREIEEMKVTEEQHNQEIERETDEVEREIYENMNACILPPKDACILPQRRSISKNRLSISKRENRVSISSKRVKVKRVSVSSINTRSPSITVKRKKKMVPNLIKLIRKKDK